MRRSEVGDIDWGSVGLGQSSDRNVAARLGIHHATVRNYREQLGIPPYGKLHRKIPWETLPLGRVSDSEIAIMASVSTDMVCEARKRLGIPAFDQTKSPKGIDWDNAPLGKKSDAEIAREYGVATPVVLNARRSRKIPRFGLPSRDVDWSALPLGEETDSAIAARIGTTSPTVSRNRLRLGIRPFKHTYITSESEGANYPEALIDLYWHEQNVPHRFQVRVGRYIADWVIREDTIVEYAGFAASTHWGVKYKERLERKVSSYQSAGWKVLIIWPEDLKNYHPAGVPTVSRDHISGSINWSQQPFGLKSDTEIARDLGSDQGTVSRWRRKLGHPTIYHTDWSLIPLGKEPDHVIAFRLGISRAKVQRARKILNITSFRDQKNAI